MKFLDIGELAQKAGVSAATLRYYEEVGSSGRSPAMVCADSSSLAR